jgi:hypothetical protein
MKNEKNKTQIFFNIFMSWVGRLENLRIWSHKIMLPIHFSCCCKKVEQCKIDCNPSPIFPLLGNLYSLLFWGYYTIFPVSMAIMGKRGFDK